METKFNPWYVGVFLVTLMVFIVAAGLWFFSQALFQQQKNYMIHFQKSVAGLRVGGVVYYNGVSVGKVKSITIDTNKGNSVAVCIGIDSTIPITTNTNAFLDMQGITGYMVINLQRAKQVSKEIILIAKKDEKYPEIPSVASTLEMLTVSAPELLNSIHTLLGKIQAFANTDNSSNIKKILSHVEIFTKHASNIPADLQKTTVTVNNFITMLQKHMINHALPFVKESRQFVKESRKAIQDISEQSTTSLKSMQKEFSGLCRDFKRIASSLDSFAQKLNNNGVLSVLTGQKGL